MLYFLQIAHENTHSSSIKVRYGYLSWVSSLTKCLPSNLLCCVQYCVILYCDISRVYSIMLYWTVLYGLYIYSYVTLTIFRCIYTYMTNDPCIQLSPLKHWWPQDFPREFCHRKNTEIIWPMLEPYEVVGQRFSDKCYEVICMYDFNSRSVNNFSFICKHRIDIKSMT